MKKMMMLVVSMMLIVSIAAAECTCMTDSVRIALFDIMSIAQIKTESADHDVIVSAYLGMGAKCAEMKKALLNVLCTNHEMITTRMTAEKIEILMNFLSTCGCGCGSDETDQPVTPTEKPEEKKHNHRGGTHENGGKCTSCGKKYQKHTWSAWTTTSAEAKHRRICSCGYEESGNHSWSEGEKKDGKVKKTCTICHYSYWGGIYTQRRCSCGCSGCKGGCCSGCVCGCH